MPCIVVDTYAWLEYFDGNPAYQPVIGDNQLKTPALVFAEIARSFRKKGITRAEAKQRLEFIERRSIVIPLEHWHASMAGELAESERLPLADAIIYSYASSEENLVTGDEDFRGKKHVLFIK